ncbi:uncharacterized protein LOC134240827 [Saccostrea cucullata]|uniref:uncharacterized protein LOC134240827 n=1 Tax=Saccostrea cuccullata TaxID=36930 RepID=UPI002ED1B3CB
MVFCLTRSMYMSVTLFWIAVFLRVLPYDFMTLRPAGFPIFPVDSCPRNLSAVETATLRLNCSEVKEFKNVYHCLPLSNLSLLVEFCYDGVSGLIEKGNCMVLENQHLNNHPCAHFTNGCPEAPYFPKNMFSFPSCIQINKQNSCYLADPRCPPVRGIADTTTILMGENETATTNNSDDVKLSLAVLTPIIVISLIITLGVMWNRGRHKFCNKDKYSGLSEETTPLKVNECKTHLEDENNKKIYEKYLKEGCIWVCPISQIIIVGENGVGKTTLLNRLKGKTLKEIKDIKSTRGIECHTKKESFIISGNELSNFILG